MPVLSITRLRVRSWRYLPAFFFRTFQAARQAARADGCLAVSVLAEANKTFWTRTTWCDESAMKAYMLNDPHRKAMRNLLTWCDEAALVHWEHDSSEVVTWQEAHRHLQQHGRRSKVYHPSPEHVSYQIAAPQVKRTGELRFK